MTRGSFYPGGHSTLRQRLLARIRRRGLGKMSASSATSSDNDFVCLYLDDFCEEVGEFFFWAHF